MTAALHSRSDMTRVSPSQDVPPIDDVVRRAQRGDVGAFEDLYRAHMPAVYALCRRMSGDEAAARELVQDAFVNAWERLGSFRGQSAFGTWLHRVTVNVVLEYLRGAKRDDARFDAGDVGEYGRAFDSQVDARMDLDAALARLPHGARVAFVLHDIEGYSHDEVAELTGTAPGTARAQAWRARRALLENAGTMTNPDFHLTEEERQRLTKLVALARSAPPIPPSPDDLWPGIRDRIERAKVVALPAPVAGREARPARVRRSLSWIGAAAAAAIAIFAIGRASGRLSGDDAASGPSAATITAAIDSTSAYEEQARVLFNRLELQRSLLRPQALAAIERDLRVVDAAIAELDAATARDPNNLVLRRLLASSYREKVDILKRVGNAEIRNRKPDCASAHSCSRRSSPFRRASR